ncbi:GNAT family N-acetyltransferase [Labilibacter sediminis]|nr:GNAT family N-acetyltransferase [Labilibacter sediminis]
MNSDYSISTDKQKLDIPLIHHFLVNDSYWANNRTLETVKTSIKNSLCFGVYSNNIQVGFARVVTDCAVFAWILDVFILKEHRGKGLGKLLMTAITNHDQLQTIKRWGLATDDAHGLYEKFGFELIKRPEILMQKTADPS